MSLKIVRSGLRDVRVAEPSKHLPGAAREIQFKCNACGKHAYAFLPYDPTPGQRQTIIKEALDEHRLVCTVGTAEQGRSYEIWYPRA